MHWRKNVLSLAAAATVVGLVMVFFGPEGSKELLAMATVSGLLGIAGGVAQDPPPPSVPAEVHERLMSSK